MTAEGYESGGAGASASWKEPQLAACTYTTLGIHNMLQSTDVVEGDVEPDV
jgi:hypothetical protein